jgi:hypothetical protein
MSHVTNESSIVAMTKGHKKGVWMGITVQKSETRSANLTMVLMFYLADNLLFTSVYTKKRQAMCV